MTTAAPEDAELSDIQKTVRDSAREFAEKCRSPEAPKLLGRPAQTFCSDGECTHRYRYDGPWTPDDFAASGSLVCSVVVDAARAPLRYALAPGPRVSR